MASKTFLPFFLLLFATIESKGDVTTLRSGNLSTAVIGNRMVLKKSPHYSEKEVSDVGVYNLYKIKNLTPKGRYFNRTEADFKGLDPGCTCVSKPSECSDLCCYGILKCPGPENSFTGEMLFPRTKKWTDSNSNGVTENTLQELLSNGEKKEKKSLFPWLCKGPTNGLNDRSRFATLMCIYSINLNSVKIFYDLNPGRTDEEEIGSFNASISFNWRNISETRKPRHDLQMSKSEPSTTPPHIDDVFNNISFANNLASIMNRTRIGSENIASINFTLTSDDSDGISDQISIVVLDAPAFRISSHQSCIKFSNSRTSLECSYVINSSSLTTCLQMQSAVNITVKLVYFLLSNDTNLPFLSTPIPFSKTSTEHTECFLSSDFHITGTVTQAYHRKTLIGSFAHKFSVTDSMHSNSSILLTLTFESISVSDRDVTDAPIFWENFIYGDCPANFCWRDSFKIPSETGVPIKLDEIFLRNVIFFILPLVSLAVFKCLDMLF